MSSLPGVGHFAKIGGALLGLLVLTIGAAYLNLGPLNTPIAFAISAAKALLILIYFMELRAAGGLMRLFAVAGFFWLGIMLTLAMSDFLTR
jgi:cytochrome c oxidase subunit 4